MAKRAFIIGGTGQIGRAVAAKLLDAGWDVTVAHRGKNEIPPILKNSAVRIVNFDRELAGGLASALADGADVVIDLVAFDQHHAAQLLALQDKVGAFVVISSISVYCDEQGRTLDEASAASIPQMPDPIPETHQTTSPGPQTYSTRKVALEQKLLKDATVPVTILRPGAIYGPGAQHPREWWFVKRILDGRKKIPLAFNGESRFSATSVGNLAALTQLVAENPATRVLNAVDPMTETVFERGVAIADYMGAFTNFVRLADSPAGDSPVGRTPWSVRAPFVAANTAARELGYVPVETYRRGIEPMVDWLLAKQAQGDWREHFPVIASYNPFDYAAEDEVLLP